MTLRKSDTWGDVEIERVTDGILFERLFREIEDDARQNDDGSGFHHNLGEIAHAFKGDRMYTLRVRETADMDYKRAEDMDLFVKHTDYVLPCVMTVSPDNEVVIIWVHRRARGRGFGRALMAQQDVKDALGVLEDSQGFFNACNVKIVNVLAY